MKIGDIVEVIKPWGTMNKVGDEKFIFGVRKDRRLKYVYIDCGAEIGWMPSAFFKIKIKRSEK